MRYDQNTKFNSWLREKDCFIRYQFGIRKSNLRNHWSKQIRKNNAFQRTNKLSNVNNTKYINGKTWKICSGDILVSDSCNNKKMIGKKNCQIGYLSQKFGCMPQLTVKEQLQYFCYLKKIPASEEEYEISRVLDAVHMSEFANQKCKKLSGGMVRRVGIAQAILGKPQFILLDEPTTGLDIEERCHFYQIFHQLEGVCPVLVSSHITEDIVEGCTNTIILKTGTILLQEKTEKIKPSLEEVYLKCMRGI